MSKDEDQTGQKASCDVKIVKPIYECENGREKE
jgi:hypothetical protein